MAIFKSSNSGIPFGNTAGRPASPGTGQPYFNGELQRLELYTGATYGWQNIVAETPGVTGYTGSVIETNSTNTITITGTNFASGAVAYLIGTDGTEYAATTTTVNNLTSIEATFGEISASKEPYDIRVTNPSNLYGVYYDVLTVNDKPVWSTAAGTLGSYVTNASVSIQLSATDEENNSLTYSLSSGTLPTGLTISSSGLISGTITGSSSQVYNFVIGVSDSINSAQTRSFSITYTAVPTVSGGTLTSDSTYYYRTFSANGSLVVSNANLTADILTVAGGGGGGGASPWYTVGGGGGAGGVVYSSSQTLGIATYTATVGGGGTGMTGFNGDGTKGVNTTFTGGSLSLTAASGGGRGGAYSVSTDPIANGGSGGGGGGPASSGWQGGTGIVGQGNNGGNGSPNYSSSGNSNNGGAGGGGAGAAGANSSGGNGGSGGSGTNSYSSWLTGISSAMTGVSGWSTATSSGYIAGGGAGGSSGSTPSAGAGGGGAGAVSSSSCVAGSSATTNTGGGGGGAIAATTSGGNVNGGSGGSGIIIVRYTKASVGA